MDTDGIHVFHVADGNRSVVAVAHHLIFNFLVALHTFLDQDLADRREREGVFHDGNEFLLAVRESSACAAQRESGTQYDRITDVSRRLKAF